MKVKSNFIKISIYFLLFVLPIQTRYFLKSGSIHNQFWEYGTFAIYFSELVLLLIVLGVVIYRYKSYRVFSKLSFKSQHTGLKLACVIFFLYLVLSNIWSINHAVSIYYTVKFIEVLLLIWLIKIVDLDYKWLFFSLVLGVLFQSVLGIWQFFDQYVYASKWLGIAAQNPTELGVSVVETNLRRFLRSYGGLPHPNIFAGWIVLGLWSVFFLFNQMKDTINFSIQRFGLLLIYILLFAGLILSFSRSAWLGFILGWVILVLYFICARFYFKKSSQLSSFQRRSNAMIVFLLTSAVMLILFGLMLREPLTERSKGLFANDVNSNRLESKSIIERRQGFSESALLIKKHPWFGSGLGTYTYALYLNNQQTSVWQIQPAHNVLLLITSELGIVGIVFFLVLTLSLFRYCYQQKNLFAIVLMVSFLPIVLVDHYLWTLYSGITLSGVIVAMICLKIDG